MRELTKELPIMLSNRHVHLKKEHVETLFGEGYELTALRDLGGEFATNETVILQGPKGTIENVRIIAGRRDFTQVELLKSDTFKLGVNAPLRDSGDLDGAAMIKVIGPKGELELPVAIVAARHMHISKAVAKEWGVEEGQFVSVEVPGERGLIFNRVYVRTHNSAVFVLHIDTEEGNAAFLRNGDKVSVLK